MKPEIEALFTKARRSVEAAKLLRENGNHDFSVSRAYYAMFYVTEALLLSLNQSYSSHSATIGAYGREYAKTGLLDPKFHRWLIVAQSLRATGDYGTEEEIAPEQSEELCLWAEEFINTAETYLRAEI